MFINKVTNSDSVDLYFDVMTKFNDQSLIKEASAAGSMLENVGKLTRVSDEAADLARASMKGGKATLSETISRALSTTTKKVTKVPVVGITPLLKGTASTKKRAFLAIRKSLQTELDLMLRNSDEFIDAAGNFKPDAITKLKSAARASGGAVNPKAADEIVDNILSGKLFDPSFKGGAEAKRLAKGADAATTGAKGADAATTGAKGTDAATTGAKGVSTNPKLTQEALSNISPAAAKQARETADDIIKRIRGVKTSSSIGSTVEETVSNAIKEIDACKNMAKTLPDPLDKKVLYSLDEFRVAITEQAEISATLYNKLDMHGAVLNAGGNITINQVNSFRAFNSILDTMDDAATRSIRRIAGVKGAVKNLNEAGDVLKARSAASAAGGSATGGRGAATVGDVAGGGGGGGGAVHLTQNFGDMAGGAARMGDEAVDGLSPALRAHLKAQTEAMQQMSNYIVRNGEDIAEQLKYMRNLKPRPREYDEMVSVIQKLENVGNVKISGKLLKELQGAGVKIGAGTTSKWSRFGKAIAWIGGIAAAGAVGHWAWNKFGPGGGPGGPGGGGPGGGGPGGPGGGGGLPPESPANPYLGITDPNLIQALSSADPNSPNYDPQTGWQNAQNTIMNLEVSGNRAQLNAFLNALQNAYGKLYRVKLNPVFVVPGAPVPLYYAFVNQQRSPAPNLAGEQGMVLRNKSLLFNDALHNPEETTIADIFDQTNMLMGGDAQRAINYTAEQTISKGLAEKDTSRPWYHFGIGKDYYRGEQFLRGKELERVSDQGIAGQRGKRRSKGDNRVLRQFRNRAEERVDLLRKFAEDSSLASDTRKYSLENFAAMAQNSTNITQDIDNHVLSKSADDFSKSYYKDALKDLNDSDKTLRSYFTGLGGLYDQRLEKRKADFKELYNVTEGSGEELIYESHPKEVVVSDSIGRGGLVENGLEQKRQTHGVALSAPTGNFRANYASRHDALDEIRKLSISS